MSTANEVTARLLKGRDKVTRYFGLAEKNHVLSEQNAQLQQRIVELEMLNAQYHLDSLAKTETIQRIYRTGYHITPAQVIDKSVNKTDNYFTLDRGTSDGVAPDMGVMGVDGVVGVVFKCTEHYSLVMTLLNSNNSISCKVSGNNDIGYLQWQGGDPRYATLHDLPRYSNVTVGDTIVTSGNSSFFPEGIMVGTVEEKHHTTDGLYMNLKVLLSTQFVNLEHVFVVSKMDAEEIIELHELLKPKKKKKK
jgi:rod shape-determining protein MreC